MGSLELNVLVAGLAAVLANTLRPSLAPSAAMAQVTAVYPETQAGRGHAWRVAPLLSLPAASMKNGVLLAFPGTSQRRL